MRGLFAIVPFSISTFLYFTFFQYHTSKVLIPICILSICYFALSYLIVRKSHFIYIIKWFLLLSIWFLFTIYFPITFSGMAFEISSSIANNLCLLLLAILLCEYDTDSIFPQMTNIIFLTYIVFICAFIIAIYQFLYSNIIVAIINSIAVSVLFYFTYNQANLLLPHKKRNMIADLILLLYVAIIYIYNFFFNS